MTTRYAILLAAVSACAVGAPADAAVITPARPYAQWTQEWRGRVPLPTRSIKVQAPGPCAVGSACAYLEEHVITLTPDLLREPQFIRRYVFAHELGHMYDYEMPAQRGAFARLGLRNPWYAGSYAPAERYADAYARCATRDTANYPPPRGGDRWSCTRFAKLAQWRNRTWREGP